MAQRLTQTSTESKGIGASITDSDSESEQEEFACSECETNNVTHSPDGEVICEECSLVISDEQIDHGPEWRAYNQSENDKKSRVGSPITETQHDKGLTTTISWQDKDGYGNAISNRKRKQMKRLRREQNRARTNESGERNLQQAFGEIDRMASAQGIPKSIREVACMIYRRSLKEDLIRGRSIEGVASSALYAACRQGNIPRSINDITTVSRVDELEISRTYKYILRELELEIEPVDPKEHVPRFCSELDASADIERTARKIIDETVEAGILSGKSPTGFAAAAIYAASLLCEDKFTQPEVSEATNTSEVTIRNRYQEQLEIVSDQPIEP